MRNVDLIKNYVYNSDRGSCNSLFSDGKKLYSYETCICEKCNGKYYVNTTKYSQTTSKHLTLLRRFLPPERIVEVEGKFRGVDDLAKLAKKEEE